MIPKPKILVVDDDPHILRMLRSALTGPEFDLIEATSGREGISAIASHNPEVVIFDLGLPDVDGVACIKEIRQWSQVPILVLSARGEEKSKIEALNAGAHDYVTKPFSVGELIARIRVGLRLRQPGSSAATFESTELHINFGTREVSVRGQGVHLTPLEYKLLSLLVRTPGRVLTHRQILSEVCGAAYVGQTHYLRILMKSLRQKVEVDPTRPKMFITETGVGYRFRGE